MRSWNVANNAQYIQALHEGRLPAEQEVLTRVQQHNEQLMVSLRTAEGLALTPWLANLPTLVQTQFLADCEPFIQQNQLQRVGDFLQLTNQGKLLADAISGELFLEADALPEG